MKLRGERYSSQEARAMVRRYVETGLPIVLYPNTRKGPTGPDGSNWPTTKYRWQDYEPNCHNVGLKMGVTNRYGQVLTDIDFDSAEASKLAPELISAWATYPPEGRRVHLDTWSFGRAGRSPSHNQYFASEPLDYSCAETKFFEVRGQKKDGTIGMQTMVPPSFRPPKETEEPVYEPLRWI